MEKKSWITIRAALLVISVNITLNLTINLIIEYKIINLFINTTIKNKAITDDEAEKIIKLQQKNLQLLKEAKLDLLRTQYNLNETESFFQKCIR